VYFIRVCHSHSHVVLLFTVSITVCPSDDKITSTPFHTDQSGGVMRCYEGNAISSVLVDTLVSMDTMHGLVVYKTPVKEINVTLVTSSDTAAAVLNDMVVIPQKIRSNKGNGTPW